MTTLDRSTPARGTPHAGRDLAIASVAAAAVVTLVVLMPRVPSIAETWGLDLENASYGVALAVLVGFVLVLDTLAAVAVVLGRRAVSAGRRIGMVPVIASALAAGFVTLMMLLSVVGHLLGME